MRIVMISENDPAGMGIAFCNAINNYTEHECRLITSEIRYNFMFEKDLHLPALDDNGFGEVHEVLQKADIIHFHMLSDENTELGKIRIKDYIVGKAILHHHHGHPGFRSNPEKFREKYRQLKRKAIVSTPDLLRLLPDAIWLPNIVPVYNPLFMPAVRSDDGKIRVCQAPTRKDLKNTTEFIDVMNSLVESNHDLEFRVIENTLYSDCLRLKQNCDIHFDHMQGYFGVSSLESLSQGKPLIAGLDDWNQEKIRAFTGCSDLPWIIATDPCELKKQIEKLANDTDLRDACGAKSRSFMENSWTEQHVIRILTDLYNDM